VVYITEAGEWNAQSRRGSRGRTLSVHECRTGFHKLSRLFSLLDSSRVNVRHSFPVIIKVGQVADTALDSRSILGFEGSRNMRFAVT
jgi:hypothetical protein